MNGCVGGRAVCLTAEGNVLARWRSARQRGASMRVQHLCLPRCICLCLPPFACVFAWSSLSHWKDRCFPSFITSLTPTTFSVPSSPPSPTHCVTPDSHLPSVPSTRTSTSGPNALTRAAAHGPGKAHALALPHHSSSPVPCGVWCSSGSGGGGTWFGDGRWALHGAHARR